MGFGAFAPFVFTLLNFPAKRGITRDYTPFLLTLQGMALQLQGIALPSLLILQGRSLTLRRPLLSVSILSKVRAGREGRLNHIYFDRNAAALRAGPRISRRLTARFYVRSTSARARVRRLSSGRWAFCRHIISHSQVSTRISRLPLCAARTLNASGQSRVSLSLR